MGRWSLEPVNALTNVGSIPTSGATVPPSWYNGCMKFGTHNLHDEAGTPTAFADIIVFTEAIPRNIKRVLRPLGYRVNVCGPQRDLVIAYKKGTFQRRGLNHYKKIHGGVAEVTPHRGVFWIHGRLNGHKAVIIAEHRINAAFPPYIRGEAKFRAECWNKHTNFTVEKIRKWKRKGKIILAAGDLNTPRRVKGYRGELNEAGNGLDRVGVHGVKAHDLVRLSFEGSDHPRVYRVIFPPARPKKRS
jgi:hypothetical protein